MEWTSSRVVFLLSVIPAAVAAPAGWGQNAGTGPPEPVAVYEFGAGPEAAPWGGIPGGFSGGAAGAWGAGPLPEGAFPDSRDGTGLAFELMPGEVVFLFALEPVQTEGRPVLLRLNVRADRSGASVALIALKGNLLTGERVDNSIATHIPATADAFVDEPYELLLVYGPDAGGWVTPCVQAARPADSDGLARIWIDRLEVFDFDPDTLAAMSPQPAGPSPTPDIPEATPTDTPAPAATPTPVPPPTATPRGPEPELTLELPGLPDGARPLELVLIPAGSFLMGSPEDEEGRGEDEGPRHGVTITRDFYIGKYEVTQGQWEAVMGGNPSDFQGHGPDIPVNNVVWSEAMRFVQNLNELGVGLFRPPTEAEWEYACRAGTDTRYYWGDDPNHTLFGEYAWNWFNSGFDGDWRMRAAGLKLPNAWGLHDMGGNGQEWCLDWYGAYPEEPQTDPRGPSNGEERVLRGGFWNGSHEGMRSAARSKISPFFRANSITFRVAMEIPDDFTVFPTPTPRPQAEYTRFGANLQSFSGGSIDPLGIERIAEDNQRVIRYFAQESVHDNMNMIAAARDRGMKVIMVFYVGNVGGGIDCGIPPCLPGAAGDDCCEACWWNLDLIESDPETGGFVRRYTCDPAGFARWIEFRLEQIELAAPDVIGPVLSGIQIGNEEEGKWGYEDGDTYFAGRMYAEYYLAAQDVIRRRWPQLRIFGGSIESHRSLDFDTEGIANGWLDDNGRWARGYLNGFIQAVLEQPDGSVDQLPDVVAINGYPGTAPPEYLHGGRGTKEWINRLDTLEAICNVYGYFPRFAVMEYGFSPREDSVYGPAGADEISQAVYYLRYNLMNAAMRSANGAFWDTALYWVHQYNADTVWDTGWFAEGDASLESWRPVRWAAKRLHSDPAKGEKGLGLSSDYEVWLPARSERGEEDPAIGDNLMRCGWTDSAGQRWGAMWRYRNNADYYYEPAPRPAAFVVPEGNPGPAHLRKILFFRTGDGVETLWTRLTETPIAGQPVPGGGGVMYLLPEAIDHPQWGRVDVTDENPVFLEFEG